MPVWEDAEPYWQTNDKSTVRVYLGDVMDNLSMIPSHSVQCVITSPPYWGLRDYGTGEWEGGSKECDHLRDLVSTTRGGPKSTITGGQDTTAHKVQYGTKCRKCGARRKDRQLGSEKTPQEYVVKMVEVFREVKRVLRDDGCLWLNLGDTYATGSGQITEVQRQKMPERAIRKGYDKGKVFADNYNHRIQRSPKIDGLKSGNLVGIPWRVALALQDDGWILRSDVPWIKRSCMPESADNRPTKALEYVFLLTKSMKYYFDMEAVKQKAEYGRREWGDTGRIRYDSGVKGLRNTSTVKGSLSNNRNFRQTDLWFQSIKEPHGMVGMEDELVGLDVTSQGYPGSHFATFGPKFVEPLLLSGTSEYGACKLCRRPWKRKVEQGKLVGIDKGGNYKGREDQADATRQNRMRDCKIPYKPGMSYENKTIGWQPSCQCLGQFDKVIGKKLKHLSNSNNVKKGTRDQKGVDSNIRSISGKAWSEWKAAQHSDDDYVEAEEVVYVSDLPLDEHPVVPCVVMDPFMGSGTVGEVALKHGRSVIGIELSKDYLDKFCVPRLKGYLRSVPALSHLVETEHKPLSFRNKKGVK